MNCDDGPTYGELVLKILTAAGGPVAVDNLVDEVLAQKATVSKNPRQLVRSKLREFAGQMLVYLDADHVLAIPLAYRGARFRIRLDHEAINQGPSQENILSISYPDWSRWRKSNWWIVSGRPSHFKSRPHHTRKKVCCLARTQKKTRGWC